MGKPSSAKFIGRNRPPRVQIEYDVETGGAQRKVEIPFVMGVMSDLSGKTNDELPELNDRKFQEVDDQNFDKFLKSSRPRVAFTVENTLTGEGKLPVDITFESLDDFSPAAIARKVDGLSELLQARTQLSNLLTYMDGKGKAMELFAKMMNDESLLQALGSKAADGGDDGKAEG